MLGSNKPSDRSVRKSSDAGVAQELLLHQEHATITKEVRELRNDIANLRIIVENTVIAVSDLSRQFKDRMASLQDAVAGAHGPGKRFPDQINGRPSAMQLWQTTVTQVSKQHTTANQLRSGAVAHESGHDGAPFHSPKTLTSTTPRGDQVVPILESETSSSSSTTNLFQKAVGSAKSHKEHNVENAVVMTDFTNDGASDSALGKSDDNPSARRETIKAMPGSEATLSHAGSSSASISKLRKAGSYAGSGASAQSKYVPGDPNAHDEADQNLVSIGRTVLAVQKTAQILKRQVTHRADWHNIDEDGNCFIRQISVRKLITDPALLNRTDMSQAFDHHPVLKRLVAVPFINQVLSGVLSWWTCSRRGNPRLRRKRSSTVSQEDIAEAVMMKDQNFHPWAFRHDTELRLKWNAFVLLVVTIDAVVTPLTLSFGYKSFLSAFVDAFSNMIYIVDFLVNLLTSFSSRRGEIQSHPAKTVQHYLLGPWAVFDLLSCFPFEKIISNAHYIGRALGMAKAVRLVTMNSVTRRLYNTKRSRLNSVNVSVFRVMRLLATVFLVSHWLSCFWNLSAAKWRENISGWDDYTMIDQYLHCWSMVIGALNASPPTMFTVSEEVTIAAYMLIGNVMQASVFGSVAAFIASIDEEEVEFSKKLISTYERCRFLDIPEKLARRIKEYYSSLYRETKSVNSDADSFIDELSPALQCEVKYQLYRDMLKQIPFLSSRRIDSSLVELLVLHLHAMIYMQDDVVTRKGEYGDWMGFIGAKGSVAVLDPDSYNRAVKRILRKGDYFGEMALLQPTKRTTTIIALSWVQVHVLTRQNLEIVKANSPDQAQVLEEEMNKYFHSKLAYRF